MKKTILGVGLVLAMVVALGAQAQCCSAAGCDEALEQLLLLRLTKECGLDAYDLSEMMEGHAAFREGMAALKDKRNAVAGELKEAIAAKASDSAVSSKLEALMAVDRDIAAVKQKSMDEAATVLDAAGLARLYLLVSDLDGAKRQLRAKLAGSCAKCMKSCAAPAAVAAVEAEAPKVSPEEAVMAGIKEFTAKLAAGDIDAVVACFSADFEHYEFGDKDGLGSFLRDAADMGYLDSLEIDLSDTEVEFKDGVATAYPIDASGAFGSVTIEIVGKEEAEGWRVTELDVSGL